MKKTLVLLYPGCISFEVLLAAETLHPHFPVLVATPDGLPHDATNGFRVQADMSWSGARSVAAGVILVPGGDVKNPINSTDFDSLLQAAAINGQTIIAGICNGALLCAKAGILEGRRCTHNSIFPEPNVYTRFADPFFKNSRVVDEPVVVDGNIVTAKPWAYIEFTATIARLAGVFSEQEAERFTRYNRGNKLHLEAP